MASYNLLTLLVVFLGYTLYHKVCFKGYTGDSLDYFQLAREITRKKSHTTLILRPWRIKYLKKFDNIPDISRGPIFPNYLALFFMLFGDRERSVRIACLILHLLICSFLIYDIETHYLLLNILICIAISLNGLYLKWLILCYSESLAVFLVILLYFLPMDQEKLIVLSILMLIKPTYFIFGIFYLDEFGWYSLFVLIPYILWAVYCRILNRSWKNEASMIIFFNTLISKSEELYWKYDNTKKYKLLFLFKIILNKIIKNSYKLFKQAINEYGEWIILSLIFTPWLFVVFLLYILIHSIFHDYIRYIIPFFPFLVLCITTTMAHSYNKYLVFFLILTVISRYIYHLFIDYRSIDNNLENLYKYQLQTLSLCDGAILTDIPWATAWYTKQLSVQLPHQYEDLLLILNKGVALRTIYLSPMATWRANISTYWQRILITSPDKLVIDSLTYKLKYKFNSGGRWDGRGNGLIYTLEQIERR